MKSFPIKPNVERKPRKMLPSVEVDHVKSKKLTPPNSRQVNPIAVLKQEYHFLLESFTQIYFVFSCFKVMFPVNIA